MYKSFIYVYCLLSRKEAKSTSDDFRSWGTSLKFGNNQIWLKFGYKTLATKPKFCHPWVRLWVNLLVPLTKVVN